MRADLEEAGPGGFLRLITYHAADDFGWLSAPHCDGSSNTRKPAVSTKERDRRRRETQRLEL